MTMYLGPIDVGPPQLPAEPFLMYNALAERILLESMLRYCLPAKLVIGETDFAGPVPRCDAFGNPISPMDDVPFHHSGMIPYKRSDLIPDTWP